MKQAIVMIGIGEMGGVFARGLLRAGHPLIPITRQDDPYQVAGQIDLPELVLVTVGEGDLHAVLQDIPNQWRDRIGLIQNELLPNDWIKHDLQDPTVISVWFEKKPGQDVKPIIPSPVFGPHAALLKNALGQIGIQTKVLTDAPSLLHELVLKNTYILTTNIAGLVTGGDVGQLWSEHRSLASEIANEVIDIQQYLTGETFQRDTLIQDMANAFAGDPQHKCMGRSAPARLKRAVELADQGGLEIKRIREIEANQ